MIQLQQFYSKLGARERMLLLVAIVVIFLMVMDRLVLGPILAQIKTLEQDIESKSQVTQRNFRVLSYRDSIYKEYEHYGVYWNAMDKAEQEIISDHLREIETQANLKSVAVSRIESGEVEKTPIMQKFMITLDCEGTLGNVLGFIHALEESNYLFQVNKYTILPKSKGAKAMKGTVSLTRILIPAEKLDLPERAEEPEEPEPAEEPAGTEPPALEEGEGEVSGTIEKTAKTEEIETVEEEALP